MPVRSIAGSDLGYALVVFDENGDERAEADGTFLSETLAKRIADPENDSGTVPDFWPD